MDNSSTLPLESAVAPTKERTTSSRLKSIFSGSVGNMVEWYDWYVYAAFSLYFAKVFFPKGDTTAQLLNTAAIFAVGFLMRPIGGWLMGLYADRKGRKAALMASVLLMCFGSLIIALTPGYETIGVGAPILLVVARLMQGLSVGGEYGTSATYLSEMATKERRGFFSSFQYVTLISGQLIALAVLIVLQQTLTTEQLQAWGWRIPFGIGALCAVVALYLRRGMEETESFTKKKEEPKVEEIKVSDLKIMPDGKIVNKSEGSIDDIYNRHQTTEKKEEGIKKDIPTPMWRRGGNGINKETKFKISKNSPLPNIIKEMIKK